MALAAGRGQRRARGRRSPRSFGSRGPVIGILLAFYLAFEPLLQGATLPRRRAPGAPDRRRSTGSATLRAGSDVHVALGTAIAVVLAWIAAALAAGAWRTRTREI